MIYFRLLALLVFSAGTLLQLSGCAAVAGAGIAAGASAAHDRRTTGTFIDDELIELKIIDKARSDEALWQQTHLNATSFNNIVLLTGETPSDTFKTRAGQIAAGIQKVRKVHNELVIAAPSSMLSRSGDSWITSKVKSQLLNQMGATATRIKIVTEKGVVYLMGILTRAEASQATELTRRVGGVERVVKLFEYTG